MKVYALRLKPNLDLRQSLKNFARANQIQAGFILTAVGSLKQAAIRFANEPASQIIHEKFEIVALSGTLSCSGIHLHIAIGNSTGKIFGGHADKGCLIYTTAEIVIGESKDLTFLRTFDPETGYPELEIIPENPPL